MWPPFGKELITRLTICSLCILTICNSVISLFSFEGGIWVLISPVPGHDFYTCSFKIILSLTVCILHNLGLFGHKPDKLPQKHY